MRSELNVIGGWLRQTSKPLTAAVALLSAGCSGPFQELPLLNTPLYAGNSSYYGRAYQSYPNYYQQQSVSHFQPFVIVPPTATTEPATEAGVSEEAAATTEGTTAAGEEGAAALEGGSTLPELAAPALDAEEIGGIWEVLEGVGELVLIAE